MENIKTRINQKRTGAPKISTSKISDVRPSICKIIYKENNEINIGTGFFMNINEYKCLITNHHVLDETINNKTITIQKHNEKKVDLKLNNKYINFFDNLDITIINIDDIKDVIKDINFLFCDLNYTLGYKHYKNNDIFALEYPKDDIEVGSGKVIEILENFEFKHNIDTDFGSSGSPIILINTLKVIGIHKLIDKMEDSPVGCATFIGEIFKSNKLNLKKNTLSFQDKSTKEIKAKDLNKSDEEKEIKDTIKINSIINKCIVKINMKVEIDDNEFKDISDDGFLCNINNQNLKVLITYSDIIDEEFLDNQEKLIFFIGNEKKEINIEKHRYKLVLQGLNFTVIEILDEDGISNDNFLEIDDSINSKNYNNEDIIFINFHGDKFGNTSHKDKIINIDNIFILQEIEELNKGIILLNNNLNIIGVVNNKIITMKEIINKLFYEEISGFGKNNRNIENKIEKERGKEREQQKEKERGENDRNITNCRKKIVIWVDPIFLKNKTYLKLRELKKKYKNRLILKRYGEIDYAINYLKNVKFIETNIIINAEIYAGFLKAFRENIRYIDVIPKIIIFAKNKDGYLCANIERKKYNKNTFFNLGGIKSSIEEIKNFLFTNSNIESHIKFENNLFYNNDDKLSKYLNYWNTTIIKDEFNFGYMDKFGKYPLLQKSLLDIIKMDDLDKYTEFLYENYSDNDDIKNLLEPIIKIKNIPIELLSKYYVRLYTYESNFYHDINRGLRENNNMLYMPYIKILYEGLKSRSLKLSSDEILYGHGILSVVEIKKIIECIRQNSKHPPIITSKTFMSFTKDKKIADLFLDKEINKKSELKNVYYVLEKEDNNSYDLSTHADLGDLSVYKNEKEVLFFPFSSFLLKTIEQININKETKYEIKLIYLGNYLEKINK